MISPKQSYDILKGTNNISSIATTNILDNYLKFNKSGKDKLIDIESTDQESLLRKQTGGLPVPGCIYIFINKSNLVQKIDPKKTYVDLVPLVFALRTTREELFGINLNMFPMETKVEFLDSYYQLYNGFFKDIERETESNKIAINETFLKFIMTSEKVSEIINIMNKKSSESFHYAYRRYKYKNIIKLRMIEYYQWQYIPFYDDSNSFSSNTSAVKKEYNAFKNINI